MSFHLSPRIARSSRSQSHCATDSADRPESHKSSLGQSAAFYVVLAPWSDVRSVDLVETDGDISQQAPDNVAGYEPH